MGTKIVFYEISNLKIILKRQKKIEEIIKKLKIDILHTHCMASTILVSKLKLNNIEKLSTIHCDFTEYFLMRFGRIRGIIYIFLYKKAIKKMQLNISCGKSIQKLNLKKANIKSYKVVNGIDTGIFSLNNLFETKKELRLKFNYDLKGKYFITSSLNKGKNIMFLVNVFSRLIDRKIYLIILGEGKLRNQIIKYNYKNIICVGKQDLYNVQKYLKIADFFISASKTEGMPNAVLEALEFNLPILLSDIEPHEEILEIDKNLGLIFKNNNEVDLSKKIQEIITKKYRSKDFEKIKKFINAKRMSNEYQSLYLNIIKERLF